MRARRFLTVAAIVFIPLFALPLFVDPYGWARAFGWDTGPETDLGRYFGRCLGAVALAISIQAVRARRAPGAYAALFPLIAWTGALLALVHLRGLLEDAQPLVEHLETLGYATLAVLAWACRPRPRA